jgi:hypothetical protein
VREMQRVEGQVNSVLTGVGVSPSLHSGLRASEQRKWSLVCMCVIAV